MAPAATVASVTAPVRPSPSSRHPRASPGDKRATTARTATILYVTKATAARKAPKSSAAVVVRLRPKSVYGTRQVLLAVGKRVNAGCETTWYRVRLPAKPNGVTGWVPARGLVSETTGTRIQVDLSARHLDLYRLGERVLRVPVAIGHIQTPTPTGSFYVDVRYRPHRPGRVRRPRGCSASPPTRRPSRDGRPATRSPSTARTRRA